MAQEIDHKTVLLSGAGGTLEMISEDGETLAVIDVPPGRVSAAQYLDLVPLGGHLAVAEGLTLLRPRSWAGVQDYGKGSHESAANPDFQPTTATRMEKEMRLTLSKMQAQSRRLEARERAWASVERIPQNPAPAPEPVEVIEDEAPAQVKA